jgi:phage shock protein C
VIGGVAAGLAGYFKIDPLLVRLLFVIFTFVGGGAILIYIIFWIATPEAPIITNQSRNQNPAENGTNNPGDHVPSAGENNTPDQKKVSNTERRHRGNLIGGLVLITIGAIFLVDQFIPYWNFGDLWPVILIVIGVALLINTFIKPKSKTE